MEACEPPSTSLNENGRHRLCVDLVLREPRWESVVDEKHLVKAVQAAYASCTPLQVEAEVSLLLCDDSQIRELNSNWRGKDSATNVLSFPLDQPFHGEGAKHLGDIVLAFETVEREAGEKKIPVGQHTAHLVVHGLLHLLGHDHENARDAEEMERLEVEILATLGVPDPYSENKMESGELT